MTPPAILGIAVQDIKSKKVFASKIVLSKYAQYQQKSITLVSVSQYLGRENLEQIRKWIKNTPVRRSSVKVCKALKYKKKKQEMRLTQRYGRQPAQLNPI